MATPAGTARLESLLYDAGMPVGDTCRKNPHENPVGIARLENLLYGTGNARGKLPRDNPAGKESRWEIPREPLAFRVAP